MMLEVSAAVGCYRSPCTDHVVIVLAQHFLSSGSQRGEAENSAQHADLESGSLRGESGVEIQDERDGERASGSWMDEGWKPGNRRMFWRAFGQICSELKE